MTSNQQFLAALRSLEGWLERRGWRAYEPHDGLSSPLRRLLGQNRMALLAFKQLVMRAPWNMRPLLGISAGTSPEAMGFFVRGYLRLYRALGQAADRARAEVKLDWLAEHTERGYHGACWGNQFDYITRFFYLPKGMPIVVWTAHNAHAFLDAYEMLHRLKYLEVAKSAAEFIQRDLPQHADGDTVCISYVPCGDYPVHNANLLGASLLARVGAATGEAEMLRLARQAVAYTAKYQRPDGSWWYGEAPDLRWVDNFHTGYVLDCLLIYAQATGDHAFSEAMFKGLDYYVNTFFLPDGTPRYFSDRTYPIDVQCAAQSIETLNAFAAHRPELRAKAEQVARWTINNLQDPQGYFYFRKGTSLISKTPMLHWGQATMFSALASLLTPARPGGQT